MSITVRVPMALRKLTGGAGEVEGAGSSVKELINNLEGEHSGLKDALCDGDGNIRGYVNIYINDEDFRSMNGVDTLLKDGDDISIIPAIAGGLQAVRW